MPLVNDLKKRKRGRLVNDLNEFEPVQIGRRPSVPLSESGEPGPAATLAQREAALAELEEAGEFVEHVDESTQIPPDELMFRVLRRTPPGQEPEPAIQTEDRPLLLDVGQPIARAFAGAAQSATDFGTLVYNALKKSQKIDVRERLIDLNRQGQIEALPTEEGFELAFKPVDPPDLIAKLEEKQILGEAHFMDRVGQMFGETASFLVPVNVASGAFGLGRLAQFGFVGKAGHLIGEGALLAGASVLHMQSQAGIDAKLSPEDYVSAVGGSAIALGAGLVGGRALQAGINRLVGSKLHESVQRLAGEAIMGGAFETVPLAVEFAPGGFSPRERQRLMEGLTAGSLVFPFSSAFGNLFTGRSLAGTEKGQIEQAKLAADALVAFEAGVSGGRPSPKTTAEITAQIRESQARAHVRNAQADITGQPEKVTPDLLQRLYKVDLTTAERLVRTEKITNAERAEMIRKQEREAMLAVAERRGGMEAKVEMEYQLGLMPRAAEIVYAKRRAEFTTEQKARLDKALPSLEEAVRLVKLDADLAGEVRGLRRLTEAEIALIEETARRTGPQAEIQTAGGRGRVPAEALREGMRRKVLGGPREEVRRRPAGTGERVADEFLGRERRPVRGLLPSRPSILVTPGGRGIAPEILAGRQAARRRGPSVTPRQPSPTAEAREEILRRGEQRFKAPVAQVSPGQQLDVVREPSIRPIKPGVFTPVQTFKTRAAAKARQTRILKETREAGRKEPVLQIRREGERFVLERALRPPQPIEPKPKEQKLRDPEGSLERTFINEESAENPLRRLRDLNPGRKFAKVFVPGRGVRIREGAPPRVSKAEAAPRPLKPTERVERPETAREAQVRAAEQKQAEIAAEQAQRAQRPPQEAIRDLDREIQRLSQEVARQEVEAAKKGVRAAKGEPTKKELRAKAREDRLQARELMLERANLVEQERAKAAGEVPRTITERDLFATGAASPRPSLKARGPRALERALQEREAREAKKLEDLEAFFAEKTQERAAEAKTDKPATEKTGRDVARVALPRSPIFIEAVKVHKRQGGKALEIIQRAEKVLGEEALRSPRLPDEYRRAIEKQDRRTREEAEEALNALLDADTQALIEANKRLRRKPKLRFDEEDIPLPLLLLGTGAAVAALARDDEDSGVVALAALPFFFRRGGKGGKLRVGGREVEIPKHLRGERESFIDRWSARLVRLDMKERRVLEEMHDAESFKRLKDSHLSTKKLEQELSEVRSAMEVGPEGRTLRRQSTQEEAKSLREIYERHALSELDDVPMKIRMTNLLERPNWVFVVAGHKMAQRGPAGRLLALGVQRVVGNRRALDGKALADLKFMKLNHDIKPLRELEGKDKQNLTDIMEARHYGVDEPKPRNKKIEIWAELMRRMFYGETRTVDPKVEADVQALRNLIDTTMTDVANRAIELELPFVPRIDPKSGSYLPVMFRREIHPPSTGLQFINPFKYAKAKKQSDILRHLIWKDAVARGIMSPKNSKIPLQPEEVNEYLRIHQETPWATPYQGTVEQVRARISPYLELHRLLDVRVGVEWDPSFVFRRYITSAYNRLELAQEFGVRMERAQALIKLAKRQGYDDVRLTELFDMATGQHPTMSRSKQFRFLNEISGAVSLATLGLSNIAQFTSWAFTTEHMARVNQLKEWKKAFKAEVAATDILPPKMREKLGDELEARFMLEAGVAIENEMALAFSQLNGLMPKLATGYLSSPFSWMLFNDRMGRRIGALVGRTGIRMLLEEWNHAVRHLSQREVREMATKPIKEIKDKDIKATRNRVEELFEDPEVRKLAFKTKRTENEIKYLEGLAGATIVNKAHGRTEPIDLPQLASHPVWGHLFKLMTFNIRNTARHINQTKELLQRRQDVGRKLAAASVAMGMSYGIRQARLFMLGQQEKENEFLEFLDATQYYGYMGAYVDFIRGATGGFGDPSQPAAFRAIKSLAGPTFENAGSIIWNAGVEPIVYGNGDAAQRLLIELTPRPWRDYIFEDTLDDIRARQFEREQEKKDTGTSSRRGRRGPTVRERSR